MITTPAAGDAAIMRVEPHSAAASSATPHEQAPVAAGPIGIMQQPRSNAARRVHFPHDRQAKAPVRIEDHDRARIYGGNRGKIRSRS
jgi:hypothetical protein